MSNPATPRRVAIPTPTSNQLTGYSRIQSTLSFGDVQSTAPARPRAYGAFGTEAVGKTSFGAFAPKPIFLMPKGETGLLTLIDAGRVPPTAHFPELEKWEDVQQAVELLRKEKHDHKVLVIDTVNTLEALLYEYVCRTQFGGDFSPAGFFSYNKGFDVAQEPCREFLFLVDQLRLERKMAVLFLGHVRVKPFKNPDGVDFDRWTPDVHEKFWAVLHRYLDVVLFMNFETVVTAVKDTGGAGKKGKGVGGTRRVIHTERSASWDAKNRLGLPESIDMGEQPEEGWKNFSAAVRQAKQDSLALRNAAGGSNRQQSENSGEGSTAAGEGKVPPIKEISESQTNEEKEKATA